MNNIFQKIREPIGPIQATTKEFCEVLKKKPIQVTARLVMMAFFNCLSQGIFGGIAITMVTGAGFLLSKKAFQYLHVPELKLFRQKDSLDWVIIIASIVFFNVSPALNICFAAAGMLIFGRDIYVLYVQPSKQPLQAAPAASLAMAQH